ncbi:MAG: molybdopterin cofactor-binding domain-containing protein [Chloroflexota bacterium]
MSGPYAIPNVWCGGHRRLYQHRTADAYRGAGRPEATYVERAMDLFAAEIETSRGMSAFGATSCRPTPSRTRTPVWPVPLVEWAGAGHRLATTRQPSSGRSTWRATARIGAAKADASAAASSPGMGISSYIEVCGVAPSK